jgi:hypothetical protein
MARHDLRAHPEYAAWFAALATGERAALLRRWPGTPDGRRWILAADRERLADDDPEYAASLRAKARGHRGRSRTA